MAVDAPPRQTWIFQANPNKYRITDSLRLEQAEFWNLKQHADKVRLGDRVLVWISGSEAGIYAVGSVLDSPSVTPDSPAGQSYWTNARDGQRVIPRVVVEYERVMLNRPLLKQYLLCDPELDALQVIRQPRGSNYRVSEAEWRALRRWLNNEWPDEVAGAVASV